MEIPSFLPLDKVDESKFYTYYIPTERGNLKSWRVLNGLIFEKGWIHSLYCFTPNTFLNEPEAIPHNALPDGEASVRNAEKYCDLTKTPYIPDPSIRRSIHKRDKLYFTLDNGSYPFAVYISQTYNRKKVTVYRLPENQYEAPALKQHYTSKNPRYYTQRVKKFTSVIDVLIGRSPKNRMTRFGGGHGRWSFGNSILLKFRNNRYVFIGESIYSFKSKAPIVKFVSPIGNNCVPYPYAFDENGDAYLFFINGRVAFLRSPPKNKNVVDYYHAQSPVETILPIRSIQKRLM